MLTYAIDDKDSFRNLQMWKNEFLYYADVKENVQFPFIVVGNKVTQIIYKFQKLRKLFSRVMLNQMKEKCLKLKWKLGVMKMESQLV